LDDLKKNMTGAVCIEHYVNDANVSQNMKNQNKLITSCTNLESVLSPITKHASGMQQKQTLLQQNRGDLMKLRQSRTGKTIRSRQKRLSLSPVTGLESLFLYN